MAPWWLCVYVCMCACSLKAGCPSDEAELPVTSLGISPPWLRRLEMWLQSLEGKTQLTLCICFRTSSRPAHSPALPCPSGIHNHRALRTQPGRKGQFSWMLKGLKGVIASLCIWKIICKYVGQTGTHTDTRACLLPKATSKGSVRYLVWIPTELYQKYLVVNWWDQDFAHDAVTWVGVKSKLKRQKCGARTVQCRSKVTWNCDSVIFLLIISFFV